MRGIRASPARATVTRLISTLLLVCLSACAGGSVRIAAHGTKVSTPDGDHVWSYRLSPDSTPGLPPEPRAVVFFVGGSGYERSVLSVMGAMAGFVVMGMPAILLERRGIEPDGTNDPARARRHSDKGTRVADSLAAMRAHLPAIPSGTPVLLVGESEGGDVAAAMARAEPRITHLILLGAGGGMTQAEELALLAAREPEALGLTPEQLEAWVADIRAHPDSDREWLGHPYRRWSSFLWSRPLDDLLATSIPIFLAQGDRDSSAPVESARLVQEAFAAQGRGHLLRYQEYAGLDHSFRDPSGRSRLDAVERDIVSWLLDQGLLEQGETDRLQQRIRSAHQE